MSVRFLCSAMLSVLGFTPFSLAGASNDKPQYTIDAIRYGTIADFRVRGLVAGADPSRKMDIAMIVWLVRGNGHTILVDSGFYRDQFFKHWKIRDFVKPSDAVEAAGVKPNDITDIIVTHMHWDHADGADLFPKARIWVQRDEYTYYTGEAWHAKRTHGGIDPDDVLSFVKMNTHSWRGTRKKLCLELPVIPAANTPMHPSLSASTRGRNHYPGIGQRLSLREPRQARPYRGDTRCGIELESAGSNAPPGRQGKSHCAGTRSRHF